MTFMRAGNFELRWLGRFVPLGAHLMALLSLVAALAQAGPSDHLPTWANACVSLLMVGGPFLGATWSVGRGGGDLFTQLDRGARALWSGTVWLIPAAPIASLGRFTAEPLMALSCLAGIACLTAAGRDRAAHDHSAAGLPWFFRPRRGRRLDAWALGLLALCAGAITINLAVVSTLAFPQDNDAAYYYGVAKHVVQTARFEEPIVWHFLTKPQTLLHAPFDYWQPLTSLILIPPMWIFGSSYGVAATTIVGLMGLALVLLWHLVVVLRLVQSPAVQLAVLLLFAFSPALRTFGFDTDSVPVMILLLVAGVWALAARRPRLAVVVGGLMIVTRSDAVFAAAVLWAAAVFTVFRSGPSLTRRHRMRQLAYAMGGVVGAYLAFNLALHGTPLPPAARLAARLRHFQDLYAFDGHFPPFLRLLPGRLELPYIGERASAAWMNLLEIDFVPAKALWWGAVFATGLLPKGPQRRVRVVAWVILFGASAALSWSAPAVFASWRTLYVMLPLALVAGGIAMDTLVVRADAWVRRVHAHRGAVAVVAAGLVVMLGVPLKELHVRQLRFPAAPAEHEALVAFSTTIESASVATTRPWFTIASTNSPAVSLPTDGEDAVEAVLRRYHVQYVILGGTECKAASKALCEGVFAGTAKHIGGLALEHVRTHGKFKLFRVKT